MSELIKDFSGSGGRSDALKVTESYIAGLKKIMSSCLSCGDGSGLGPVVRSVVHMKLVVECLATPLAWHSDGPSGGHSQFLCGDRGTGDV